MVVFFYVRIKACIESRSGGGSSLCQPQILKRYFDFYFPDYSISMSKRIYHSNISSYKFRLTYAKDDDDDDDDEDDDDDDS